MLELVFPRKEKKFTAKTPVVGWSRVSPKTIHETNGLLAFLASCTVNQFFGCGTRPRYGNRGIALAEGWGGGQVSLTGIVAQRGARTPS